MPCDFKARSGTSCVADAAADSRYCAVHAKYALADSESRCAKCTKKIRTGTYATKRADGQLEHTPQCPKAE